MMVKHLQRRPRYPLSMAAAPTGLYFGTPFLICRMTSLQRSIGHRWLSVSRRARLISTIGWRNGVGACQPNIKLRRRRERKLCVTCSRAMFRQGFLKDPSRDLVSRLMGGYVAPYAVGGKVCWTLRVSAQRD